MKSTNSFPPPFPCGPAVVPRAASRDRTGSFLPIAREALDTPHAAQGVGFVLVLVIWLLVFCFSLWSAWSAVWFRLAAAVSH